MGGGGGRWLEVGGGLGWRGMGGGAKVNLVYWVGVGDLEEVKFVLQRIQI